MKPPSLIVALSLITILGSCKEQNKLQSNGFIVSRVRLFDSASNDYSKKTYLTDRKLWFHDSLVIQEVYSTRNYTDSSGKMSSSKILQYYIFMDLRSKRTFHFSSFSDTARILEQFILDETDYLKGKGGWSFYLRNYIKLKELKYLSDTLINNITYKRISFIEVFPDFESPTIGLLRCDLKGSIFQFDKNITEITGCPMTTYYQLPTATGQFPTKLEIQFERFHLTNHEKQVFNSWKKNLHK